MTRFHVLFIRSGQMRRSCEIPRFGCPGVGPLAQPALAHRHVRSPRPARSYTRTIVRTGVDPAGKTRGEECDSGPRDSVGGNARYLARISVAIRRRLRGAVAGLPETLLSRTRIERVGLSGYRELRGRRARGVRRWRLCRAVAPPAAACCSWLLPPRTSAYLQSISGTSFTRSFCARYTVVECVGPDAEHSFEQSVWAPGPDRAVHVSFARNGSYGGRRKQDRSSAAAGEDHARTSGAISVASTAVMGHAGELTEAGTSSCWGGRRRVQ